MELVEGETLRCWSNRSRTLRELVTVVRQIAAALARAHELGIVHRDLKPDNVMVAGGVAKVLDFGLAKMLAPLPTDDTATASIEGRLVGTPSYMAPEQSRGRSADERSDVFSFGALAYEVFTGKRAFERETMNELLIAIDRDEPRPMRSLRPDIPQWLVAVVERCLRKKPEERWSNGGELARALARQGDERKPSQWIALALAATGAVSVLVLVARAPQTENAVRLPSSARMAAPPSTTLSDLPLPPTQIPEARSEFVAGIQSLRDGNWITAASHFVLVTTLDPTMAAGHFRRAMTETVSDAHAARAEYAAAVALRAQLGERDRALLDALEPAIGRVHKDPAEASARLGLLIERYPFDVELLVWRGALGANEPDRHLAAARRATELDPKDAGGFENAGMYLALLGRTGEARAAFEQCAAVAVDSGDCLEDLARLEAAEGHCEEGERVGRRLADRNPIQGVLVLAQSALALGRPEATVRELLAQFVSHLPEGEREHGRFRPDAWLAGHLGRFDIARAIYRTWADYLSSTASTSFEEHALVAYGGASVALETGDRIDAIRIAKDFESRSPTWETRLVSYGGLGGLSVSPWLARLAFSVPSDDRSRSEWIEDRLREGANGALVWSFGWAAPAFTEAEGKEALEALHRDARLLPPASTDAMFDMVGLPDSFAGRAYLLAGRPADALPFLRRAAGGCLVPGGASDQVRALLDLGRALEKTGNQREACDSYGRVVAKWGRAIPRSASAEIARDRMRSLRCSM
jgi:serine/threonine-protein kinase